MTPMPSPHHESMKLTSLSRSPASQSSRKHATEIAALSARCAKIALTRKSYRRSAVADDRLAGGERARLRGQEHGRARDLVRLADAAQRRALRRAFQGLRVLPQRAREIGFDQARRDAVGADVVRAVLDGDVARELHVGSLGDAIGAE